MKRILFTVGFFACILGASFLRAEPSAAGQNPGIAGIARGGPVGALNDEQRASYQAALQTMHGRMAELEAKLRVARQDVLNNTVGVKFDENLVREKVLVVARIEAELAVIRAKALSEVQPPLSSDQIEKIKSSRPGQMRPIERQFRRESPASTNHDANGLPPKQ